MPPRPHLKRNKGRPEHMKQQEDEESEREQNAAA